MLLGIVMFGEWPDGWMLVGSATVVATGLFTLYRERRVDLSARR
jgi:S-adenosylmethionine uptake transporter